MNSARNHGPEHKINLPVKLHVPKFVHKGKTKSFVTLI